MGISIIKMIRSWDRLSLMGILILVRQRFYRNISLRSIPTSNHAFVSNATSHVFNEGLPYIPRVHLSEGSLVRSPLKWLWSEEPMVRRSFFPKFLYSDSCYVPKIPYSERPSTIWILCYEDSLVRSSSSPKGAMFRTSIFRKSPLPHTSSILRRSFSPKFPQF